MAVFWIEWLFFVENRLSSIFIHKVIVSPLEIHEVVPSLVHRRVRLTATLSVAPIYLTCNMVTLRTVHLLTKLFSHLHVHVAEGVSYTIGLSIRIDQIVARVDTYLIGWHHNVHMRKVLVGIQLVLAIVDGIDPLTGRDVDEQCT